jgi:hypothetical protein
MSFYKRRLLGSLLWTNDLKWHTVLIPMQTRHSTTSTCTWFAPKNKVYAGSGSLQNRIAMAVGITSMGVLDFYKKLFARWAPLPYGECGALPAKERDK